MTKTVRALHAICVVLSVFWTSLELRQWVASPSRYWFDLVWGVMVWGSVDVVWRRSLLDLVSRLLIRLDLYWNRNN